MSRKLEQELDEIEHAILKSEKQSTHSDSKKTAEASTDSLGNAANAAANATNAATTTNAATATAATTLFSGGVNYVYVGVAVCIPIVITAALYFIRPRFVTIKQKGKLVISWPAIFKYAGGATIVLWLLFIAAVRFGLIDKLKTQIA